MTVASRTYSHQTAPWDSPLSFGVQAFIEYNGYVINDRHQADRIRVTSITGLDGADITDSREVVPGDEGEFVYDSWYRGRALDDETPIPTPNGWRLMKDLRVGDQVFDDKGEPCNVISVYPQPSGRPCYEVWFSSGKTDVSRSCIIADADHRWATVDLKSRIRLAAARKLLRNTHAGRRDKASSRYRGVRSEGNQWVAYHGGYFRRDLGVFDTEVEAAETAATYRVQRLKDSGHIHSSAIHTTKEISATLRVSNGDTNHAIRIAGPLRYSECDLPIRPYTLGAWLGDGNSYFPKLYVPEWDEEIIDYIRRDGYKVTRTPVALEWIVRSTPPYSHGLGAALSKMGLLSKKESKRNKHIPREYMQSSIKQRRALLAGLLDTDGTVGDSGRVEFDNTNERLANDVLELVLSLGYRAVIRQGVSKRRDGTVCGPQWNVSFVPNDNVFWLSRKTETWRARRAAFKYPEVERFRYIVEVKSVASRPVRCISVDSPNHLYLAGREMIPTHNTFVISGDIQAGSLGVCKRLERDLKAAFAPLSEAPMKFRWFDVYDTFDDPQTLQNYTATIGSSASLAVSGGVLQWLTTSNVMLMRSADNRLWGDAVTTVRIVVGSTTDASTAYVAPCLVDANNYLQVSYNVASGTPTITIAVVDAGVMTVLATTLVTGVVQGQSIWLRARKDGDYVTGELWASPPSESTLPTFTVSASLTGSDADSYGDQVLSQVGFGAQTVGTNWALDDFRAASICPADVSFWAKPVTKPSIKESQDSMTQFKRSFQVTVRTSKPYAKCSTQSHSQVLVPTSGNTTQLGFGAPLTAPLTARTIIPGSVQLQNQILFVRNRGTAPERPLIVVYGAISNLILLNLTNGQQINWTGVLADGDYLAFDCAARTLVNSSGTSQKQYLITSIPQWMWLEPNWNDVFIAGSSYSTNTKLLMFYRGSWN